MAIKFLNDIDKLDNIQFINGSGANAGLINMDGNDLVLSNPLGDILLGDGASDVYIGDGANNVDILFEQSGSIKADDSASGVTLTLGSSNTTLAFGGNTSFAGVVTAISGTSANAIDLGTNGVPFRNIYAANHVGGSSINYATSRGWVEDAVPLDSTNQAGFYGGNFVRNGDNDENALVRGQDPFNNKALLWKCILHDTDDDADGGWNKEITIPANNNIGYLSYVYFMADFTPDSNTAGSRDGTVYLGCSTTSGSTINISDNSSNTNPYFISNSLYTVNNSGPVVAERWYLMIGVIQPYNDETTGNDTISGVYDVETGERVATGSEFKMGNNTTSQVHRAYVYYDESGDAGENVYFWNPGFHAIDGSEPKLQDLLKRQIYVNDNVKAAFGDSDDLQIYHDGSDSIIKDSGTGSLDIYSSHVHLKSSGGTNNLAQFFSGGNSYIYANNVLRIEATTSGVNITGNMAVSGTVDGRDVATDGTKLDTIATNADVTPSWVPSSDPSYLTSSSTQSKYLRSDANDTATGYLTLSGGVTGSNSLMTSFFLPQNPEGSHVKAPWFFNDMAYARLRGATITVTVNGGSSPGNADIDKMFDAATGFWNMPTSGVTSVVIEITNPPKTMYHGAHYGVTFGNTTWRANSVDIEAYYSSAYQQVVSTTSNSKEFVYGALNSGGNAVSKIKWTFSNFNTTSMRIVSLFAYNYDSTGMPSLYLAKDGGEMYGDIDMGTNTITDTKVGQWDTAYGWGNHASAGYLTGISGNISVGTINMTGELNFTGAGSKYIDVETLAGSNNLDIRHHNPTGNLFETAFRSTANGGTFLYYNNNTKFATTNTGISITGDISASGTVDGRDVATDGTKLDTISTNADVTPSWVPSSDPSYLTAHPNISAASSVNNSGKTYVQDITLDSNGHVTGLVSDSLTGSDFIEPGSNGALNSLSCGTYTHTTDIAFSLDSDNNETASFIIKDGAGNSPFTLTEAGDLTITGKFVSTYASKASSGDILVEDSGEIKKRTPAELKTDLSLNNVPNTDATNASNLASGTVPTSRLATTSISKGGTGATTALAARTALGLGSAATSNTGDFAAANHNHDSDYAALSHNHAASSIVTGTLADARISESSVTQHEAALSITEGQLPDDMPSDKVKQICTSHHNFFMNSSSTSTDFFVPFNNLNESSNPTNAQYYNRMVAPYNGRIVKVVLHTTAAIGTSCQALFWVATSAGVFAPSAAETVTGVNLNTANTSATATFSTSSTAQFSEGDVLGVSIIKSSSATANMQVTVVWEYTL